MEVGRKKEPEEREQKKLGQKLQSEARHYSSQ